MEKYITCTTRHVVEIDLDVLLQFVDKSGQIVVLPESLN